MGEERDRAILKRYGGTKQREFLWWLCCHGNDINSEASVVIPLLAGVLYSQHHNHVSLQRKLLDDHLKSSEIF